MEKAKQEMKELWGYMQRYVLPPILASVVGGAFLFGFVAVDVFVVNRFWPVLHPWGFLRALCAFFGTFYVFIKAMETWSGRK